MQPIIVHLEDRRLKVFNRYEAFQQAVAAVTLMSAGYGRIHGDAVGGSAFSVALMAAGALLFVVAVRELRGGKHARRPELLNLAAGVALMTEWGVSFSEHGRWLRPSLLMAIISFGLAAFHDPVQRGRRNRRTLRMDDQGLSFWLNPIRRFKVRWDELEWISVLPREILFRRRSGRQHRIPLGRLENAEQVTGAVVAGSRDAGVAMRTAGSAAAVLLLLLTVVAR